MLLLGSNFGAVGAAVTVRAWAVPTALPPGEDLSFEATGCTVVEAHVTVNCTTAPGIGSALSWRVYVDGLLSTVPLSSYRWDASAALVHCLHVAVCGWAACVHVLCVRPPGAACMLPRGDCLQCVGSCADPGLCVGLRAHA